MVVVQMGVFVGLDEIIDLQIVLLCYYMYQQCIVGDIEWQVEEYIVGMLIQLVGEFVVGDVELEEGVVWCQCYFIQFVDVLC